jgi:imidazole glycerol-phosphate synthase subunit HisH
MEPVAIVDSGGANIASLRYALERLGVTARLTSDPLELRAAPRVILPGVGAAGDAMQRLRAQGLAELLPTLTQPVLGICLGMQLLYEASAENDVACLGVIPGRVQRLAASPGRPVPHMGWNQLSLRRESPLTAGIADGDYVYFLHGFAAAPGEDTLVSCDYGGEFAAVVQHGNFFGTQFHPERSAGVGRRLLGNFLALPAWN